jgi:hypothetical protein
MVFVRAHGAIGTDLTGLASLNQPDRPLSRQASTLRRAFRPGGRWTGQRR